MTGWFLRVFLLSVCNVAVNSSNQPIITAMSRRSEYSSRSQPSYSNQAPHVVTRYHDEDFVGELVLNNPKQSNAMTPQMLRELPVALDRLLGLGARAIVVHSIGVSKNFCAGLSIESLAESASTRQEDGGCQARRRWHFREYITKLQKVMTIFEACRVPVIAGVHGACVGAGVDLITACDVRLCTSSASFCVKEVDLGIVADMGTLSRLPGIVGDGIARQLSLTAETIDGTRAKEVCLVSDALPTDERLLEAAMAMARGIAAKSPLAVAGTKEVLLYVREHGRVEDGLAYVATLNAGILPEKEDVALVMERVRAGGGRGGRRFAKL